MIQIFFIVSDNPPDSLWISEKNTNREGTWILIFLHCYALFTRMEQRERNLSACRGDTMWIGSSDHPVVAAPFDSSGCHKWWSLGEWQQFTAITTLRSFPSLQQSHFLILKLQIAPPLANSKCVLIGQWLY